MIHRTFRRMTAGLVLVFLMVGHACAADVIHARTERGDREAWAVPRPLDRVSVTEIWVDGGSGEPRLAGTLPGGVKGMWWRSSGDRLVVQDRPLEVSMIGLSLIPRRSRVLCEPGTWELDLKSGRMQAIEQLTEPPGNDVAVGVESVPSFESLSSGALQGIGTAFMRAASAYNTLHNWDLELAKARYEQAAQVFAALPRKHRRAKLFRPVVDRYTAALKQRARDVGDWGRRLICREHLTIIGDLLGAYEEASEGRRPPSLLVLKTWAEGHELRVSDQAVLSRLFRSPADPDETRPISYEVGYRPGAKHGEAVVTSHFHAGHMVELVADTTGYQVVDRLVTRAQVDSLLELGTRLMESDPRRSIQTLEILAGAAPSFAQGHNKLGYAYLEVRNLRRAIRSFERATACDRKLAEAYFGLGLAYRQWPRGKYDAIRYFQKALRYNRHYIAARFNIAELRYEMEEHDAKRDLDKLFREAPLYPPAMLLMGKWHEDFAKDYGQAAVYYAQYMSLRPEDPEGPFRLGRVYLKTKDFGRVYEILQSFVEEHPEQYEALPILAQACARLKMQDRAEFYWQGYLARVPPEEHAPYEDIRLLATREDLASLAKVAGSDQEASFLDRFWQERDPDLTTAVNERRMEHWRRVWYARQNFSEGMAPWDQRGEVYVRFGEPDHRSRSDEPNFVQSLEVQRVKERLAREIYGDVLGPMRTFGSGTDGTVLDLGANLRASSMTGSYPGSVYPVRSLRMSVNDAAGPSAGVNDPERSSAGSADEMETAAAIRTTTYRPVTGSEDGSMVPWESWIYVDLQGGIEITFTDELANGIYDYAPAPMGSDIPVKQLAALTRTNPSVVAEKAMRGAPNHYVSPENKLPLGLYYDLATFRGKTDGETLVEVYLAIPRRSARYLEEKKETRLDVMCTVGMLNEETGMVFREEGGVRFRGEGDLTGDATALVPHRIGLQVPAGRYRLELKAVDAWQKRVAHYRQQVVVENYAADSLRLSRIHMAWRITEADAETAFMKDGLEVVPLPTRTYDRGSGVFAYYEIYNMSKDEFGRTHYQVTYDVRPVQGDHGTGVISMLTRLGRDHREAVAVSYDRSGESETEVEFVELRLSDQPEGQQILTIRVEDLILGRATEREVRFSIGE